MTETVIIFEVSTTQYSSYRAAVSQQNQVKENYIHSVPNTAPQTVILQPEQHLSRRVVREVSCEPPPPPVPLFPPPTLRSSTETAACIATKKAERTKRFVISSKFIQWLVVSRISQPSLILTTFATFDESIRKFAQNNL